MNSLAYPAHARDTIRPRAPYWEARGSAQRRYDTTVQLACERLGLSEARAFDRFPGTPAPRAGKTRSRRAAWPALSLRCEALPPHLRVLGAPGWPSDFSLSRFQRKPARACREDSQVARRVCSAGWPALGHAIERRPTQRRELRAKRTRARPPGGVTQRHAQPLHCSTWLEHGNEAL